MTRIAAFALCLAFGVSALAAAPERLAPEPRHSSAARIVAELLGNYHYRDQSLDDGLARAALTSYFDMLDPQRYYFRASDIAEFEPLGPGLDEALQHGELETAWAIFRRYRERVRERANYVAERLATPLDLENAETFRINREESAWPAGRAAQDELWRKRLEHDTLSLLIGGDTPREQIRSQLIERYTQLADNLDQYQSNDVFEIYMDAWSALYDPHTSYLSPRSREDMDIDMSLSLQGIGALLRSEGNHTEIVELIAGGPAAKSGRLGPGDQIIGVAQGDGPFESVVGWRIGDVVQLIRGPKGSTVRLRIVSGGAQGEQKTVSIVRSDIVLEDRAAQSRVERIPTDNGKSHRVGVVTIPSFYRDFKPDPDSNKPPRSTTRDVRRLITDLRSQDGGIDSLVIDLRGNGGGSLREATMLTGLFIESGPVVQIRYGDGETNVLDDEDNGTTAYDGPMVVLVDQFSASASEIFAAALQDYGRALIVGDQTFGKGTVQELVDLNRYQIASSKPVGTLKFTRAKYYRITGGSTQLRGVAPDISMENLLVNAPAISERSRKNALPWDEIHPVRFKEVRAFPNIIDKLTRLHNERVERDAALTALREEREHTAAQLDQEVLSLQMSQRRAERERFVERRLALVNQRLEALGEEPVSDLEALDARDVPDVVLREAAHIASDLAAHNAGTATPTTLSASTSER